MRFQRSCLFFCFHKVLSLSSLWCWGNDSTSGEMNEMIHLSRHVFLSYFSTRVNSTLISRVDACALNLVLLFINHPFKNNSRSGLRQANMFIKKYIAPSFFFSVWRWMSRQFAFRLIRCVSSSSLLRAPALNNNDCAGFFFFFSLQHALSLSKTFESLIVRFALSFLYYWKVIFFD